MKQFFLLLKKSTVISYLLSLIITSIVVFRYAHISKLSPGFELMLFSMKTFLVVFFILLVIFFFSI